MRLLPPDKPELGWMPYLWLIYLVGFLGYPVLAHSSLRVLAATGVGTVVFLFFSFWGYWLSGERVLWSAAGLTALALLYSPWNPGSTSLWIFAAAALGKVDPPGRAFRWLLALLVLLGVEAWLAPLPAFLWAIAGVFSLVVGGACIHYAEASRASARLLRAQEEVERLAQVAERERISRDLHDLLGHTLTLITLKAELAGKLLARGPGDPEAARREIADLERISREALQEVRSAISGYRADLASELARARLALEAAGVALDAEIETLALSPAEESALAFALREAVTNVIRHAAARRCRVRLSGSATHRVAPAAAAAANRVAPAADRVALEVEDDGQGGAAPEGAGLSGMRERIAALGGRVERQEGGTLFGTRLIVSLPRSTVASPRLRVVAAGR